MKEILPFATVAAVKVLDTIVTEKICSKHGIEHESNPLTTEYMEEQGVKKGLWKKHARDQVIHLGVGAVLYGLDSVAGIQNNFFNLHKTWLYGQSLYGTYVVAGNCLYWKIFLSEEKTES